MLIEFINNTLYILEFVVVSSLCFRMKYKITVKRIMVSDIANISTINILSASLCNTDATIISLIFLLFNGITVNRKFKKGLLSLGFKYILLLAAVLVVESAVVLMLSREALDGGSDKYRVMFLLTIIGVFVQIGTIILLVLSRNVSRENEILMKKYLNEQTKHYSYLENKERETKKFRHDLRNHMHTLMTLYNEQKYDEVHKLNWEEK